MQSDVAVTVLALLALAVQPSPQADSNPRAEQLTVQLNLPLVEQSGAAESPAAELWHPLGQLGGATYNAAVDGQTAFLATGCRIVAVDLSQPNSPRVLGKGPMLPDIVAEVAAGAGRAYALTWAGDLQVLAVEDPSRPRELARHSVPGWWGHLVLDGPHLYVAIESGVAIMNVDELATGTSDFEVLATAQYAVVAANGGRLYVATDNQILAYDPATESLEAGELPTGIDRVLAATATRDRLYISTADRLLTVDTTDTSAPVVVSQIDGEYDEMAARGPWLFTLQLAHPAGLTVLSLADPDQPVPVAAQPTDHQWHFLAAGEDRLLVVPSDSQDDVLVFDTSGMPELGMARSIDDVQVPIYGVIGLDDAAYVQQLWEWRIVDLAQPDSGVDRGPLRPWLTAGYETGPGLLDEGHLFHGRRDDAGGSWIDVLDVSVPLSPTLLASIGVPDDASVTALAADGGHLYAGTASYTPRQTSLQIFDVTDIRAVQHTSGLSLTDVAPALAASAGFVFAGVGDEVIVVDASNPDAPHQVAALNLGGKVIDLQLAQSRLFAVVDPPDSPVALVSVDLSQPAAPALLASLDAGESSDTDLSATTLIVRDGLALVGARWFGVDVVDVTVPGHPRLLKRLPAPGDVIDMALVDDRLYAATVEGGLTLQSVRHLY